MKQSLTTLVVKDLYEIVQTILFLVFSVSLLRSGLAWLIFRDDTGIGLPLSMFATMVLLCVAYVVTNFVSKILDKRQPHGETPRPNFDRRQDVIIEKPAPDVDQSEPQVRVHATAGDSSHSKLAKRCGLNAIYN